MGVYYHDHSSADIRNR